jgi:lipoprotein-anchoring transpeptidase ErfK/SrfK
MGSPPRRPYPVEKSRERIRSRQAIAPLREIFAGVVREDELVNTLKPLLIAAVLAGIGYGVYVRINRGNDAPPPGAPESWDAAPKVELPPTTATAGAPSWSGPGGVAPPFSNSPAATMPPSPSTSATVESAPPYAGGPAAPTGDEVAGGTSGIGNPGTGAPEMPAAQLGDPSRANPFRQSPAGEVPPQSAAGGSVDPAAAPPYGADAADRYRAAERSGQIPPTMPGANSEFALAIEAARHDLESGQLASALQKLSVWYDDSRLSPQEQQQLNQLLDQVAGTVVYSTQHLMEPPYEVQPGERLEDIAQRYSVPWELLAKVNGIDDPSGLRPGERLKVVRGPFSALVSLDKRQLTLLTASGAYAGRFNIGIGREHPPREGVFAVSDKVVNPVYHGADRAVSAGDQGNPLGLRWIGLGSELGIHGTNQPENIGRTDLNGSISLGPRDVEDVFDILSVGSRVVIRR